MFVLEPLRQEDIMEAKDFQALVDQLGDLTKEQCEALIEAVNVLASASATRTNMELKYGGTKPSR